jgi:hypothetical protein
MAHWVYQHDPTDPTGRSGWLHSLDADLRERDAIEQDAKIVIDRMMFEFCCVRSSWQAFWAWLRAAP